MEPHLPSVITTPLKRENLSCQGVSTGSLGIEPTTHCVPDHTTCTFTLIPEFTKLDKLSQSSTKGGTLNIREGCRGSESWRPSQEGRTAGDRGNARSESNQTVDHPCCRKLGPRHKA